MDFDEYVDSLVKKADELAKKKQLEVYFSEYGIRSTQVEGAIRALAGALYNLTLAVDAIKDRLEKVDQKG